MTGSLRYRKRANRYRPIYLAELRQAAGGRRRFNLTDFCTVELPDGRIIRVDLVKRKANLGGLQTLAKCPCCGADCRVLRLVPWPPGLACNRDVRRQDTNRPALKLGDNPFSSLSDRYTETKEERSDD